MKYQIANAFSKDGKGGNPAAVVINQSLTAEDKQEIAKNIGFSETAFLQYDNDRLHIEFFTPNKPIAYCVHATIAAVNILRQQQLIGNGKYILLTNENPIPVNITGTAVYMQQAYPVFEEVLLNEAAAMLNIAKDTILSVTIARNGVGFLLVELNNEELLYHLEPNESLVYEYSAKHDLIGVYPFVRKDEKIRSRMFGPYYEIKEENATGMAAGLLGGWLHHSTTGQLQEIFIEQGYSITMKERGYLHVKTEKEKDQFVIQVGGAAVVKSEAEVTVTVN